MRAAAHPASALQTLSAFGQLWTDEVKDRTGMVKGGLTLEGPEVLERRALGVTVGVPRRNVKVVQHLRSFHETGGHLDWRWKFPEKTSHHVPPGLLMMRQMERFQGLLRRLLGRDRPTLTILVPSRLRVGEVSLSLLPPVCCTICHRETVPDGALSGRTF